MASGRPRPHAPNDADLLFRELLPLHRPSPRTDPTLQRGHFRGAGQLARTPPSAKLHFSPSLSRISLRLARTPPSAKLLWRQTPLLPSLRLARTPPSAKLSSRMSPPRLLLRLARTPPSAKLAVAHLAGARRCGWPELPHRLNCLRGRRRLRPRCGWPELPHRLNSPLVPAPSRQRCGWPELPHRLNFCLRVRRADVVAAGPNSPIG